MLRAKEAHIMIQTKKRVLYFLLAVSVAQWLPAGGKTEGSKGATTGKPGGALEFSILHSQGFVQKPTSDYLKKAMDKLNVKITFVDCDASQAEQVNLTLASGNVPDVMMLGMLNGVSLDKLVDQDLIRELPEAFSRQNAPWMSALLDRVEPTAWAKGSYKGKQWTLPQTFEELSLPFVAGIRKDWCEKLGITVGEIVTLEDLEAAFKKIVDQDPDGNGKKDTYALTSPGGLNEWQFGLIFGAFGVRPGYSFSVASGKAVYSPAQPGYKEALKTLARWYKSGLLDPEFITDTNATATEKFGGGKVGYFAGSLGQLTTDMQGSSYHPAFKLKQANPAATIQMIAQIKGPGGVSGSPASEAVFGWHIVMGKHVTDQKAAAILRFYDGVNSDMDKWLIMENGFEGENYYIDKEKGMVRLTQEQQDLTKKLKDERTGQPGCFRIPARDMQRSRLTWGPILDIYPKLPLATRVSINFVPDWPTQNAKDNLSDIQKLSTEFAINAITGKLDADKEWDSYLAALRKRGLSTLEAEYDARYQKLQSSVKK